MQLPVQTRLYAICRYLGYALLSRYRTKVSPGSFVSIGGFMVSDYIELARNIS